jgi:hypothetical protein
MNLILGFILIFAIIYGIGSLAERSGPAKDTVTYPYHDQRDE